MKLASFCVSVSIALMPGGHVLASEWGCEVLLCAASDNPSWQGVPTCRPPMERLISAMKKPGFSWPTCPEGGAGKPGHERYRECPAGWTPSRAPDTGDRFGSSDLSQCSRTVDRCQGGGGVFGHGLEGGGNGGWGTGEDGCVRLEFMARPLREKPYFFDIAPTFGGEATRHFFNLDR